MTHVTTQMRAAVEKHRREGWPSAAFESAAERVLCGLMAHKKNRRHVGVLRQSLIEDTERSHARSVLSIDCEGN